MTLLATTDKLTGLMNRERFNAILSRKLWERPLVFMFDVDHFKHINDTRGHLWGNEVLARVGHKAEEIVGKAAGAGTNSSASSMRRATPRKP